MVGQVFRTRSPGTIPAVEQENRFLPSIYKQRSDESLRLACEVFMKDRVSYMEAEMKYGVPKSTIYDHVSGWVLHGARSGPSRYLSDEEEQELVFFLIRCTKLGMLGQRIK